MRTDSAICIDCAVTIEAHVPGSAVLDTKGTSPSALVGGHRGFEIKFDLVGQNITGGYASASSTPSGAVLVLDIAGGGGESWMVVASTNMSTC